MVQLPHRHGPVSQVEPPDVSPLQHSASYSWPGEDEDAALRYLGMQIVVVGGRGWDDDVGGLDHLPPPMEKGWMLLHSRGFLLFPGRTVWSLRDC